MLAPAKNNCTRDLSPDLQDLDLQAQGPNKCGTGKSLSRVLRYPVLLGRNWRILPPSIQRRFMKYTPPRKVVIYQGRLQETRISIAGLILAKLAILLGSPLPLDDGARGPATVIVREAKQFNGQFWTRIYPTRKNKPQVIQSIKRFGGATGLDEMLSPHVGVALTVKAKKDRILFISDHYFLQFAQWKISIPSWLTPGKMTVTHKETNPRRFRFTLELIHPLFGELIYQTAIFEEIEQ